MVSKEEDDGDFGDDFDEGNRADVNKAFVARESEQLGHKGKAAGSDMESIASHAKEESKADPEHQEGQFVHVEGEIRQWKGTGGGAGSPTQVAHIKPTDGKRLSITPAVDCFKLGGGE